MGGWPCISYHPLNPIAITILASTCLFCFFLQLWNGNLSAPISFWKRTRVKWPPFTSPPQIRCWFYKMGVGLKIKTLKARSGHFLWMNWLLLQKQHPKSSQLTFRVMLRIQYWNLCKMPLCTTTGCIVAVPEFLFKASQSSLLFHAIRVTFPFSVFVQRMKSSTKSWLEPGH